MGILYSFFIRCYGWAISLVAIRNAKAKKWVEGRENWKLELNELPSDKKWIWVHCASLGEFEQGRPIIESIRKEQQNRRILLTFYSPSGYEVRKNYDRVDKVMYMPLDTRSNAEYFLKRLHPSLVIFIKYEIWPNFFRAMKHQQIPLIMVSAIFRSDQRFFQVWGNWFKASLQIPKHIFVQDEGSKELLLNHGIEQVSISGDTRFDRVVDIANNAQPIALLENFIHGRKCIVVGSSWQAEERIVQNLAGRLGEDYCFVLAPHEIDEGHLKEIELRFSGMKIQRYSQAQLGEVHQHRILVMDNMGMLSRVYRYAQLAIIGGGFGKGLHNSLEAAVYGIPLAYGPNHKQFKEARELVQEGAALSNGSEDELVQELIELMEGESCASMGTTARNYVLSHVGATESVMDYIRSEGF